MRDWYEIRKKDKFNSESIAFDECNMLSIIRMTRTRNKTLHKRLVNWFKRVNSIEKTDDMAKILDGIEEILK